MALESELGRLMTERGLRVAVAEATAGGLVSARLVSVPGSSAYFELGVVAYGRRAKTEVLGVPDEILQRHGSVSEETAFAMAEAVRALSHADIGVAETGIAGPKPGHSSKPIGTVCIAVSGIGGHRVVSRVYEGDRTAIREGIAQGVLEVLLEHLTSRQETLQ